LLFLICAAALGMKSAAKSAAAQDGLLRIEVVGVIPDTYWMHRRTKISGTSPAAATVVFAVVEMEAAIAAVAEMAVETKLRQRHLLRAGQIPDEVADLVVAQPLKNPFRHHREL
jgi:hypothetical protein